tara:strand:- start:505 stop:1551 length:1047 start_codon:yes stop_codon:yes gene_type:complete
MSELADYDYELPPELIAQEPSKNRDEARLLVVDIKEGRLEHAHVSDLPEILLPDDVMVVNNTKVVAARLVGQRVSTGGKWQGLFLERNEDGLVRVLSKTRGKLHPGEVVRLIDREGRPGIEVIMVEKLDGGAWVVRPEADHDWEELLLQHGRVPLPPYIRSGEMVDADRERYQTVYAATPGAVAAPTAGLHFSEALLRETKAKIQAVESVTLHVGIGTFRPVSADTFEQHEMHSEWCEITPDCAQRVSACRENGGRIFAVGTTSVRVLETASKTGSLDGFSGNTDLFIYPPYAFKSVDMMMTNFHLPKSTLLLLVSAFAGKDLIREAYAKAVENQYRFYSYGDAMLLF